MAPTVVLASILTACMVAASIVGEASVPVVASSCNPLVEVPTCFGNEPAVAVAVGFAHTCLLLASGDIDCIRGRVFGEGLDHAGGDAIGVATGGHTCVLLSTGNIDCYGPGDPESPDPPFGGPRGQAADRLGGDALAVAAGLVSTCALLASGDVDCWGQEGTLQYDGGDAVAVDLREESWPKACALLASGNVDCSFGSVGSGFAYAGGDATAFAVGTYDLCVLTVDRNVLCSYGASGEDQRSYFGGDAVAVAGGESHACALRASGDVECWGLNVEGQAEDRPGGDAVAISAGFMTTCALLRSGSVDCWGAHPTDYVFVE